MKIKTNIFDQPSSKILALIFLFIALNVNAQDLKLNFSPATNTGKSIDSVRVENVTRGILITVPGRDVLLLKVSENSTLPAAQDFIWVFPNPMKGLAEITFYAKESGNVRISIYDVNGRMVISSSRILEKGVNNYQVKDLADGLYLINVAGNAYSYSTKLVSHFSSESKARLTFNGSGTGRYNPIVPSFSEGFLMLDYSLGDKLLLTAFSGNRTSVVSDIPVTSKTIYFAFDELQIAGDRAWTCGSPIHVNHTISLFDPVNKSVDYGTVSNIPGEPNKCWITSNLGADHRADSLNDASEQSAGWYWQFNKKRGYKHDGHVRTPNTNWITPIVENSDWRPDNDPCTHDLADGWRIPTATEWDNVEAKWSTPWTSGLLLHHAGFLSAPAGNLMYRGRVGLYWSSKQEDENHALFLDFDWGVDVYRNKAYAYPVRCIREYCMTADAGPDEKICGNTDTLAGNDPAPGTGKWREISGNTGYSFSDDTKYNSIFTGTSGLTYILRWTIYYPGCDSSYDDVSIVFLEAPSTANAGPDQTVNGTYTYLNATQPAIGTGVWKIVSGTGGVIADTLLNTSRFDGIAGTTYILRWTVSNNCGSNYDDVIITFQNIVTTACPGLPTVTYGNKTYNTVQIGTQCWLKENLDIGTMIPGNQPQTNNNVIEKWCYNNDTNNCKVYGGLYQWDETMQYTTNPGVQGLCPSGWHVPTETEWTTLTNYLGGYYVAGGKCKETGYAHWSPPNTGATNLSDFTGLGGGNNHIFPAGVENFLQLGESGDFATSTYYGGGYVYGRVLYFTNTNFYSGPGDKNNARSIRCLKN